MRPLVRALLVAALWGAGCTRTPDIGLNVRVPGDVRDKTTWVEVAAYKDATCEAINPMLGDGVPDGYVARTAFTLNDASPTFGKIPSGKYAFAASARDKECNVLAAGCREVDVASLDTVNLSLEILERPSGRCGAGASCQAGRCVPANENLNPAVGAGCSLELLGTGPLPVPTEREGTLLSAPAIVATPEGFVIVYRELSGGGADGLISIQPIDPSGGALKPTRRKFESSCAESDDPDGIGLVLDEDQAMVTLAKEPCSGDAELQLLNFRPPSTIGTFLVSPSGRLRVRLGAARPAALRPQGGVVVFTGGGVGTIADFSPTKGIIGTLTGTFGGPNVTDAWVAATPRVMAVLAAARGALALDDAGAPLDAGLGGDAELRLVMVAPDTPLQTLAARTPSRFPGEIASIAAKDARVIVASDDQGASVAYRAFDLGTEKEKDSGQFSVEGEPKVTALDVQILGDRAYFASLKQGQVAINVFDGATTQLRPIRETVLSRIPRISGVNIVRDGRVALAATETRVGVVWTTAKKLGRNDSSGGYAVFACTQ